MYEKHWGIQKWSSPTRVDLIFPGPAVRAGYHAGPGGNGNILRLVSDFAKGGSISISLYSQSVALLGPLLREWGRLLQFFLPSSVRLQSPPWLQSPVHGCSAALCMVSRLYDHVRFGVWQIPQGKHLFKMVGSPSMKFSFLTDLGPSSPDCLDDPEFPLIFSDPRDAALCLDSMTQAATYKHPQRRKPPLTSSVPSSWEHDLGCLSYTLMPSNSSLSCILSKFNNHYLWECWSGTTHSISRGHLFHTIDFSP